MKFEVHLERYCQIACLLAVISFGHCPNWGCPHPPVPLGERGDGGGVTWAIHTSTSPYRQQFSHFIDMTIYVNSLLKRFVFHLNTF